MPGTPQALTLAAMSTPPPPPQPPGARHPRLELVRRLPPGDVRRVLALVDRATEVDGVVPLSEHVLLHLRHGGEEPGLHLLLVDDTAPGHEIVGYAHLDPTDQVAGPSAELVVSPPHRGRGLGTVLVEALEREAPGRIRLWAHGLRPESRKLATSLGYEVARELWQMRRALTDDLPEPVLPPDVRVRTFDEDDAYDLLELNAEAFANHPEQGTWTSTDLSARMSESWFDPQGLFLAETTGADGEAHLVAFHWTKVHGDPGRPDRMHPHGHRPIGEVYVVGVSPRAQGHGLGRSMTLVGLHHLRSLGLEEVLLYVDADNTAAVRTYTRLGFTHWDSDVQFSRPSPDGPIMGTWPTTSR